MEEQAQAVEDGPQDKQFCMNFLSYSSAFCTGKIVIYLFFSSLFWPSV